MKPHKQQKPLISNALDGQGIKVVPRDSVDVSEIADNARRNLELFPKDKWLTKSRYNNETAWLVTAGPSLRHLLSCGFLRPEWFKGDTGNKLFTIKHALPILNEFGFSPHFCTVLDPRPIQGISTHGHVRQDLYAKAPKSTKFLVASMTHPSVTKWLMKNGYEIYGWHSAANGLTTHPKDLEKGVPPGPLQDQRFFVQGGTCSATRSISLAHFMGFRTCNLVAYDSNLPGPPADKDAIDTVDGQQVKKYWETSIGGGKSFWTTGELIAQIQDLQMFLSDDLADIEIRMIGCDKGTSLGGQLNETVVNRTIISSYKEKVGLWRKNDKA